jgi:hypothetical protein
LESCSPSIQLNLSSYVRELGSSDFITVYLFEKRLN